MKIGIDASFLRKQNTGIGQVTINFLKKLMEVTNSKIQTSNDGKMEFFIYLEEDVDFEFPENFHKRIFLPFWKRDDILRAVLWQKHCLPKKAAADGCEVFLSLFQCTTILPKKIKHIMVVHDVILEFFPEYLSNWRKKYFWTLSKKAIASVDKIVAVSHRTEKDLIQKLKIAPEKITVAHVDVDEIYKKTVSEIQSKKVLAKYGLEAGYLYNGGGLEVRKNTEGVLRAYKMLLEKAENQEKIPKLVISGKMMPQLKPLVVDVEEIVEELELKDKVELLGFVRQHDLPALYHAASIFLYPSKYEGFGLPILEAMNQGVPTITSKKSSLPEIGSDGVLYCDPDNVEDLFMVMRNLLRNEKLQEALSEKAKVRAKRFSMEKFASKILHIAENIKN